MGQGGSGSHPDDRDGGIETEEEHRGDEKPGDDEPEDER